MRPARPRPRGAVRCRGAPPGRAARWRARARAPARGGRPGALREARGPAWLPRRGRGARAGGRGAVPRPCGGRRSRGGARRGGRGGWKEWCWIYLCSGQGAPASHASPGLARASLVRERHTLPAPRPSQTPPPGPTPMAVPRARVWRVSPGKLDAPRQIAALPRLPRPTPLPLMAPPGGDARRRSVRLFTKRRAAADEQG
jgi:hypothetical protein